MFHVFLFSLQFYKGHYLHLRYSWEQKSLSSILSSLRSLSSLSLSSLTYLAENKKVLSAQSLPSECTAVIKINEPKEWL